MVSQEYQGSHRPFVSPLLTGKTRLHCWHLQWKISNQVIINKHGKSITSFTFLHWHGSCFSSECQVVCEEYDANYMQHCKLRDHLSNNQILNLFSLHIALIYHVFPGLLMSWGHFLENTNYKAENFETWIFHQLSFTLQSSRAFIMDKVLQCSDIF